jgi:hypothetical protein
MAHRLFKQKSVQLLVALAAIAFSVFCVRDFIGMVRRTHARAVQREFVAAVQRLQDSPPGVERVDNFVRGLKAIDPSYAPEDVKVALRDYTEALDQSLNALKAGRDAAIYDPAIAHAKEKLIESIAKYDPEFADAVSKLQADASFK